MVNNKKIIAVMPAYNTEKTIERAIKAIPRNITDEIIVANDGSRDATEEIAKKLGAIVITHPKNRGYGAAQKTGYREALDRGADIVVMVHSDFQYDPTLLPQMIEKISKNEADVCFGSRMHKNGNARANMPWWRFIANRALTILEEAVLKLRISEYHSGYRAFSKEILAKIPFEKNSDNYVFDSEMLAQLAVSRARATEIVIPTRYLEDSQSPNFWKSTEYGLMTLMVLIKFLLHKLRLKASPLFAIQ